MTSQSQKISVHTLRQEMGLTEDNIERRKKIVDFSSADLARVISLRELLQKGIEELTATFFRYLSDLEEARGLISNPEVLETARLLKREHLSAMVQGDYGVDYVEQRLDLGLLYSKAQLDPRVFLGAFHHLLKNIGVSVMKHHERAPLEGFEKFMSLNKIAFFDLGLIIDVLIFERERVIHRQQEEIQELSTRIIRKQQEAIQELSTPVLQIRDRLLLLPIIGTIDSRRALLITENILKSIRSARAKVIVMDVTGVAIIDSKVANHLLQTVNAARLMGALVIVTGLSSQVSQSLVTLGIDLKQFNTIGDLQGGIEEAETMLRNGAVHGERVAAKQLRP